MVYTVYILKSEIAQKSYVGVTDNIERRLGEHNAGRHSYTKKYLPWKIVQQEKFPSFKEAREREKFLKSTSGRRFLKKLFDSLIKK